MLLHGVLLLAWLVALRTPALPPRHAAAPGPISYLRLAPALPAIEQRRVREAAAEHSPRAPLAPRRQRAYTPVEPQAITTPAAAAPLADDPAAVPSNTTPTEPRLLDTPATRRALREAARSPGWGARAAQELGGGPPSPSERLGEAIESSASGDCLKGEFAGAGLGLLSVPFLALAALREQCRR
jgi:hypothetical protein